jgi:hypothetical protein
MGAPSSQSPLLGGQVAKDVIILGWDLGLEWDSSKQNLHSETGNSPKVPVSGWQLMPSSGPPKSRLRRTSRTHDQGPTRSRQRMVQRPNLSISRREQISPLCPAYFLVTDSARHPCGNHCYRYITGYKGGGVGKRLVTAMVTVSSSPLGPALIPCRPVWPCRDRQRAMTFAFPKLIP